MSSEFMPLSLDTMAGNSAYTSRTTAAPTDEDLGKLGITVKDPDDSGLEFEDFLQLMVQQLQNQTMDNTADTSEMLNQLVQMSTVEMLATAFTGIGMALVLKAGATTGGTDMVAAIIQSHMRHYTVVQVMQVLDAAIVILGLYVFGLRPTLYAVVSIFVSTKISDAFLEGFKTSKAAFIITNRYEEVAERLMDELDRGVTGLHAQGMYTEEKKCVLYCVVSRKEIVRVKEIVNDVDSSAFVIVSDVREVLGEGFLEYSDDF